MGRLQINSKEYVSRLGIPQRCVPFSSCEAELYAANGLMVERMFPYRVCRFLCDDRSETNSKDVQQQPFYIDSSSAMALMQCAGTGRLKHVQIKLFWQKL